MLYLLVIASLLLILLVTPTRAEYFKGLWRARKQGRGHLSWWEDLALNRVFLVIASAIVLATATAAVVHGGCSTSPGGSAPFRQPGIFRWPSRSACW